MLEYIKANWYHILYAFFLLKFVVTFITVYILSKNEEKRIWKSFYVASPFFVYIISYILLYKLFLLSAVYSVVGGLLLVIVYVDIFADDLVVRKRNPSRKE